MTFSNAGSRDLADQAESPDVLVSVAKNIADARRVPGVVGRRCPDRLADPQPIAVIDVTGAGRSAQAGQLIEWAVAISGGVAQRVSCGQDLVQAVVGVGGFEIVPAWIHRPAREIHSAVRVIGGDPPTIGGRGQEPGATEGVAGRVVVSIDDAGQVTVPVYRGRPCRCSGRQIKRADRCENSGLRSGSGRIIPQDEVRYVVLNLERDDGRDGEPSPSSPTTSTQNVGRPGSFSKSQLMSVSKRRAVMRPPEGLAK